MKKPYAPLMLLLALLVSFNVFSLPFLNSFPSAKATIYLDFDGHFVDNAYWNNAVPFACDPSAMTDEQVTEVFNRVAEDYRPFDINITTDEAKFLAAPLSKRIRIIITPTSDWFTGVGGVSFVGSFKWGDDTPGFVFSDRLGPNSAKMIGECCSHESGHAVGLSHQSTYDGTCNLTATYNEGGGTGSAAWAPIMGNSYYRNMSGWNNGPTPYGCTNMQDNLSIITSQNGFTYRADDFSNDFNSSPGVITFSGAPVSAIISTNTDKDAFTFTLAQNAIIHLTIKPFGIDANLQGANLDVKMSLYNSDKVLVRTYDPSDKMDVLVDTLLNAGVYYLLIDGAGNNNVNDYGSLGSYTISSLSGTILPIRSVTLKGIAEKNKHTLNWLIQSDEPIKFITLESSADGIQFKTVNTNSGLSFQYSYMPVDRTPIHYRLKVTSALNHSVYSNMVVLKAVANTQTSFAISTFVQHTITVNGTEKFHYLLSDINGKFLSRGIGMAGTNRIDISRMPAGMYLMQLLSNKIRQTEKIIKQ